MPRTRCMLLIAIACLALHITAALPARTLLAPSPDEGRGGNRQEHRLLRPGPAEPVEDEAETSPAHGDLVRFGIRYVAPDAETVYILWALDNWQVPDRSLRPPGSTETKGYPCCRMNRTGDEFSISLDLPAGATLDYCFHVLTPSRHVDMWDTNGAAHRDYHSRIVENGEALIITQLAAVSKGEESQRRPASQTRGRILLLSAVGLLVVLSVVVLRNAWRSRGTDRVYHHSM